MQLPQRVNHHVCVGPSFRSSTTSGPKAKSPLSSTLSMKNGSLDSDPGHSFQAIREQIFGSNESSEPGSDERVRSADGEYGRLSMARTVMSGFKTEVLPVYTELANEFVVFDRWLASVPASTQPNRFYVHSATSHGAMSNVRKDLIHGFPQKTIFDSLDENDLDFGIYYQNIPAALFFKSPKRIKHRQPVFQPFQQQGQGWSTPTSGTSMRPINLLDVDQWFGHHRSGGVPNTGAPPASSQGLGAAETNMFPLNSPHSGIKHWSSACKFSGM